MPVSYFTHKMMASHHQMELHRIQKWPEKKIHRVKICVCIFTSFFVAALLYWEVGFSHIQVVTLNMNTLPVVIPCGKV